VRAGSLPARVLEAAAALFMCAPVYVVGLTSLLLFGTGLGIVDLGISIPTSYTSFRDSPLRWAGALLAPWIVLGLPLAGVCLRMMRASMTEVLGEDYLRTARAKGVAPRTVVRRHAVPSALAPVFSLTGVTMPLVITNLILIEQVYSVPGVFTGMRRGIAVGDWQLLFGLTAVAAALVAVSGLVTDLLLMWVDPRMRTRA
jgi:peptide/nickel transport system permease protein